MTYRTRGQQTLLSCLRLRPEAHSGAAAPSRARHRAAPDLREDGLDGPSQRLSGALPCPLMR